MAEEKMNAEMGGFDQDPNKVAGQPAKNTGDQEANTYQPAGSEAPHDNLVPEIPKEGSDLSSDKPDRAIEYTMNRDGSSQQASLRLALEGARVQNPGIANPPVEHAEDNIDRATVSHAPEKRWWQKLGLGSKSSVDNVAVPQHGGPSNPGRRILLAGALGAAGLAGAEIVRRSIAPGVSTGGQEAPSTPAATVENATQAPTKKAESTATNTVEPTATNTVELTESPKPEVVGNGKYNSVEEMPKITPEQKEAIDKFLAESEIMTIGDGSIVAVPKTVMEPHDAVGPDGKISAAPQLKYIGINKELFPEGIKNQDRAAKLGLYFASVEKYPGLTFEDYNSDGEYPSELWAYTEPMTRELDGDDQNSGLLANRPFDNNAVVVYDVLPSPGGGQIQTINEVRLNLACNGNVVYVGIYAKDFAGLDFNPDKDSGIRYRYNTEAADQIGLATTVLSVNEINKAGVTSFPYTVPLSSFYPNTEFDKLRQQVNAELIPIKRENYEENMSIYKVNGVSAKSGQLIESSSSILNLS